MTKTVIAEKELTIHKSTGFESVLLLPGDSLPLEDLAEYQQKAVLEGKIPGLKVKTGTEQSKAAKEVKPEAEAKNEKE